jgi:hypothetical protein
MATLADIALKIGNQQEILEKSEGHLSNLSAKVEEFVRSQTSLQSLEDRAESGRVSLSSIQSADVSAAPGGGVGGFLKGLLPAGLAGGISGLLAGGGVLAGIIGLIAVGALDSQKVKDNVETLLSIGDRYSENSLSQLAADGAVILAIGGLGKALIPFAVGGALNAGVEYFAGNSWAQSVKDNVTTLLSIADDYTASGLGVLFDGAGVSLALGGLGLGLIAFGVGQSITALGQWVTDTTWAQTVKDNVTTLLSIADGITGNVGLLLESATFFPAMTGLAAGLAVFAVGTAATGLAQFVTSDGWAQQVKDNVLTLLSISDELGGSVSFIGDSAAFLLSMAGIGAGLAAFGAGAVLAGGTDMLSDWFSTGTDWSQQVKDNVATLLSIANLEGIGADTAKFVAVMTGIGAGLLAFSVGAGASSVSDAIADWITEGEGRQNWSEQVKTNVKNLLSIVDDADEGKATSFVAAMAQISAGLVAFSAANFVDGLLGAATGILNFFRGDDSAFAQIKLVADQAEELEKGAAAVNSLTNSIEKLGALRFDGSRINMREFAEDLAASVPVIEKAIMGGTFDDSWLPFTEQEIMGLANPNVNYDDAIRNIANLRSALGIITENSSSQGGGISPSSLETLNVQQIIAGTLQTGSDLLTEEPPSSQPIVVPVPVERPAVDRAPSGNGGGGGAYLLPASPTIDILDAVPSYDARMYQGL